MPESKDGRVDGGNNNNNKLRSALSKALSLSWLPSPNAVPAGASERQPDLTASAKSEWDGDAEHKAADLACLYKFGAPRTHLERTHGRLSVTRSRSSQNAATTTNNVGSSSVSRPTPPTSPAAAAATKTTAAEVTAARKEVSS